MTDHPRAIGLLAHVARGLLRHDQTRTAQTLGDRSTYVGLSDVARAVTCLRAAVAAKLNQTPVHPDQVNHWLQNGAEGSILEILRRQMVLQRGHWLEAGLEAAFRANGAQLISQMELIIPGPVPLRAHVDFTFVRIEPRPAIRVLELKSTEHLPQTLYPGYEAQLYGQIGLLARFWNQPVFGAAGKSGQTFPQLSKNLFGIALPDHPKDVDIEGWVLCLAMSDAKAFGPYRPSREMLYLCLRTAETLWTTTQGVKAGRIELDSVATCPGFHPLCDWCDHADGCPKFDADPINDPSLDSELAALSNLKTHKADLEARIDALEARVRRFCRRAGRDTGWLSTGRFRFKTSRIHGRKTIDSELLRAELINRIGAAQADSVLTQSTTEGRAYERLTVASIKDSQT